MDIIFLDIQGTLITTQSSQAELDICPIALSNLRYILQICKKTKIVLTGDFKKGKSLDELKEFFNNNNIEQHRIYDRTPPSSKDIKLVEIKKWLKSNNIDKYVIVDSDDTMGRLNKYYFKVNPHEGLMYTVSKQIINFFENKNFV